MPYVIRVSIGLRLSARGKRGAVSTPPADGLDTSLIRLLIANPRSLQAVIDAVFWSVSEH